MIQLSTTVRNARLDAIEAAIGASPKLLVFTGPQPASCAANATGTLLATVDLPADWMEPAANAAKVLKGPWPEVSATAAGRAGHYRVLSTDNSCQLQGNAVGPWATGTAYAVGDQITSDGGKVYRAMAAGTSAASGSGPAGNGNAIADGGVSWAYVQATADMALVNGVLAAGQSFSISVFSLTDNNA